MIVIATSSPRKWKIGSELIKIYQNTNFSHVLICKDGLVYEASHGQVHSVPFEIWRVENKLVNIYIVQDEAVDMDYVIRMAEENTKYGFMQIIRIAIKYFLGLTINKNNGNSRLICSEYVGRALKLDWVTDYTSPADIDAYLRRLKKNE